jgi:hypothetical protein
MRHAGRAVLIAAASLALAGCSRAEQQPSPQQSPATTSVRVPGAAATGAPQPRRTTLTAAPAAPAATPAAPAVSATPSNPAKRLAGTLPPAPKRVERLPADAAPQILDVAVSQTAVQPGDHVVGRVVTSSNVASVEARIGGYAMNLRKVGVGRFELAYTVGSLPWFVHGNFTMQLIARNTRGDAATRAVALTVR